MTKPRDMYPDMGKKVKQASLDDCLEVIKEKYPNAYMEGSAGLQRSFFMKAPKFDDMNRTVLVGHAWSNGLINKKTFNYTWWVRVAPEPMEW